MKHLLLLLVLLPVIGLTQIGSVQISSNSIPTPISRNLKVDSFNHADPLFSGLSDKEKELLYWLNYSRSYPKSFWDSAVQPILSAFPNLMGENAKSLEKELLANKPLPLFKLNQKLGQLAQKHAKDLAQQGKLNHTSSTGKRFDQRIQEAQIKYCAGENLASSPSNMLFALCLLYLDIEVTDLGHRKALLNSQYTELGLGVSTKNKAVYYVVQDFACAQ